MALSFAQENELAIGDIMDSQLETSDGFRIGRVADIEAEMQEDGSLVLVNLITGPQALAGRIAHPLRHLFRFFLHDRFEYTIPLADVREFGPTLYLSGKADDYATGRSERWLARYILCWIPGSGHADVTSSSKD